MLNKFVNDCLPWVGLHAGKDWEEEGVAETCNDLTATPIPHPPDLFRGEDVEELGAKLILRRKEVWGEGIFRFVLIFYYPTLFYWQ